MQAERSARIGSLWEGGGEANKKDETQAQK